MGAELSAGVSKGLCLYGVEVPDEACCFSCMESIVHAFCAQKVEGNRGAMDCPERSNEAQVEMEWMSVQVSSHMLRGQRAFRRYD